MANVDHSRTSRRTSAVWRLIRSLVARPIGADRVLPIIWFVRPPAAVPVLETLAERLVNTSREQVPHVRLEAAGGKSVHRLLIEIGSGFAADRFGAKPLRFRRLFLADHLMSLDLSAVPVDDRRGEVLRRLRLRRSSLAHGERAVSAAETWYGTGSQLLSWLVRRVLPTALFRVWASSRIPLAGNPYRWYLRQRYLAPQQASSFAGFAVRLTAGLRDGEVPAEVDKLLVHAFLEDLRYEYRRWPLRMAGWRRTAYPVLLLRGVEPETAGRLLLRVLSEVRNETGQWDPLLVVCTAEEPPPGMAPLSIEDIEDGHEVWVETLPQRRRVLDRSAWYLPVELPDPPGTPVPIRAARVPWFAQRTTVAAVVLALIAAGTWYGGARWGWDARCLPRPFSGNAEIRLLGGQCIGYSDSSTAFKFGSDPVLRTIQERIFAQNREVDEQIAQQPNRPRVTLVYLGTLTGRKVPSDVEAYVAEREELEGMAVAQYARMKADVNTINTTALLRIVIANGGFEMRYASEAVDMLAGLAARDPTVLGVVGLVESRANTLRALEKLKRLGLLAVAPTLSADRFHPNSLYLQIAPTNADQAKLIAAYARDVLHVGAVRIYYTTGSEDPVQTLPQDLYVNTLLHDLKQELGSLWQNEIPYRGENPLHECDFQGMLLFAGRWTEFEGFVTALHECGRPRFHLVADDSVNRYMANTHQRGRAPAIPLAFVSKAAWASCERLGAAAMGPPKVFHDFIGLDNLLPKPRCRTDHPDPETGAPVPVGERVALAYDATVIVANAVDSLASRLRTNDSAPWQPELITSVAVHSEILLLHAAGGTDGVSGHIEFDRQTGEPKNKRISMMQVDSIHLSGSGGSQSSTPREAFFCEKGICSALG